MYEEIDINELDFSKLKANEYYFVIKYQCNLKVLAISFYNGKKFDSALVEFVLLKK